VCFDDADNDVKALLSPLLSRAQHGVGLADTRAGAKKELKLSPTGFLRLNAFKKLIWIRTPVRVLPFLHIIEE
jgi:hypothetical protein